MRDFLSNPRKKKIEMLEENNSVLHNEVDELKEKEKLYEKKISELVLLNKTIENQVDIISGQFEEYKKAREEVSVTPIYLFVIFLFI